MEQDLLRPMQVTVIPGVGPATAERLRRLGVHTVEELERLTEDELVRVLGQAHGAGLYALARAQDDRSVEPEREAKSISVEDTYETDHVDKRLLEALLDRQAAKVTERLRKARISGRTVSIKVRLHDFSTVSRSATLSEPSDDGRQIARVARRLLGRAGHLQRRTPARGGRLRVRRLDPGVPVHRRGGRARRPPTRPPRPRSPPPRGTAAGLPGMDVVHEEHGRGWVWGSGRGVVTVRFETAETGPGRVLSFPVADPALAPFRPPEE